MMIDNNKELEESSQRDLKNINWSDIAMEKDRPCIACEESIESMEEESSLLEEVFSSCENNGCKSDVNKELNSENLAAHDKAVSKEGDESLLPPLRPYASSEERAKYEYEKNRCKVYKKYNMFYVPSYKDSPQILPNIASVREESDKIPVLKKSLKSDTFSYNSWLHRNSYNTSTEHKHIIREDDDEKSVPGMYCAKPNNMSHQHRLPKRRYSDIPLHRRPSISAPRYNSLLNKVEYVWIEGVQIKKKESVNINHFNNLGIKLRLPEKSPSDYDSRIFLFRSKSVKDSGNSRNYDASSDISEITCTTFDD